MVILARSPYNAASKALEMWRSREPSRFSFSSLTGVSELGFYDPLAEDYGHAYAHAADKVFDTEAVRKPLKKKRKS